MNKSLYSLMLMDRVVQEIDRIALQQNTNRSNLINQILADYVSLVTPEKRIDTIFHYIEDVMNAGHSIIPYVEPNNLTMSMKSSLEYKYRPTIKYEVQLYRVPDGAIGELSVIFRTQSVALLHTLQAFFTLWTRLERLYLAEYFTGAAVQYSLDDGKWVRSIAIPRNRDYSSEEIGDAISSYINMFDELMKGYLNGRYTEGELEKRYVRYLNQGIGLI